MSALHLHCKMLFDSTSLTPRTQQTLIAENGVLTYVGPTAQAPTPQPGDTLVDASEHFVMPGLVDVHTH
ncbi:MAG: amidohydrolase family protein, partial [Pseudomonas sp.]